MLRRAVAGLLLVTTVAGACARSEGKSAKPQTRTEQIPVELTIELRGDRQATVRKQVVKSQFIVIEIDDKERKHQTIFGVEPVDPIDVNGTGVKVGVAVNPFDGDGKYTVAAGSVYDAAAEEEKARAENRMRSRSSVAVEWWPKDKETEQFVRREQPCKVTVKDNATRGTVECPRMTGEARNVFFSLKMTWDVV